MSVETRCNKTRRSSDTPLFRITCQSRKFWSSPAVFRVALLLGSILLCGAVGTGCNEECKEAQADVNRFLKQFEGFSIQNPQTQGEWYEELAAVYEGKECLAWVYIDLEFEHNTYRTGYPWVQMYFDRVGGRIENDQDGTCAVQKKTETFYALVYFSPCDTYILSLEIKWACFNGDPSSVATIKKNKGNCGL